MADAVFVDTSAWFALIERRDSAHRATRSELARVLAEGARLITTDYVVDESCTHLKVRAGSYAANRLLDFLADTSAIDFEWIGSDRFDAARSLFRKHADQGFSFTDCTSFVVMEELGLVDALTTDEHFRVKGFRPLLA